MTKIRIVRQKKKKKPAIVTIEWMAEEEQEGCGLCLFCMFLQTSHGHKPALNLFASVILSISIYTWPETVKRNKAADML